MTTLPASKRRYRWMLLLVALSVLALTAISTESAAWTSKDLNSVEGEYRTGYAYHSEGEYYTDEAITQGGLLIRTVSIPLSSNYRGWASFSIANLDDRTHIASASLNFLMESDPSTNLRVKIMSRDIHTLDPKVAYNSILQGTTVGTVNGTDRYYSVNITGNAIQVLRTVVAGDGDYLVFGFCSVGPDSAVVYVVFMDTFQMHLDIEYDDEAPDIPSMVPMDPYITGDHVPVTWSPASDNPSGGNRGEVTYQVGVYLPDAPADNPYHTSPWVDGTSWNFTGPSENIDYTFRVRARDGSGFVSNWTTPVNTTVDNSPPSVPVLAGLPPFKSGTWIRIYWTASVDAGVGNVTYQWMASKYRHFPMEYVLSGFNQSNVMDFTDYFWTNVTFYFRVRAMDDFRQVSAWSPIESTLLDAEPPTVPEPIEMLEYTRGTSAVFSWFPSEDGGSGVRDYGVEVATTPDFAEGSTVGGLLSTTSTHIGVDGLVDGVTYYYRVRARDNAQYLSTWSQPVHSTQDASPPSAPGVHPLPAYVPAGPLTITWAPAFDGGVGVARYEVYWDRPGLEGPPVALFPVLGQSLTGTDLGEGGWTFWVRAVDGFGHVGPWSSVNTTVDATPPTAPVLEDLPEFTKGTSITLRWSPSTDDSGIDHYRVIWRQSTNYASQRCVDINDATEATIVDLQDGALYWYRVEAYDVVGNSMSNLPVGSTQDASPPPAPYLYPKYPIENRDSTTFRWNPVTDGSGAAVEYKLRGQRVSQGESQWPQIEYPWTLDLNQTVEGLVDSATYSFHVIARDALGWESGPSNDVTFRADLAPPAVKVHEPTEGEVVTGIIVIHAEVSDVNPWGYFMQFRPASEEEWGYIVYWTEMGNPPWFFASWDTSALPDGDYVVRATHVDEIGWQGYAEVNVTLANAHLSFSPLDITFFDVPDSGGKIDVLVEVHNTGDVDATGITVQFLAGGEVGRGFDYVTILAHSSTLLHYNAPAVDGEQHTVRVSSDIYDTLQASRAYVAPDKDTVEDAGSDGSMLLAVIALALALIALLIAFITARGPHSKTPRVVRKGDEGESEIEVEDEWVESRED